MRVVPMRIVTVRPVAMAACKFADMRWSVPLRRGRERSEDVLDDHVCEESRPLPSSCLCQEVGLQQGRPAQQILYGLPGQDPGVQIHPFSGRTIDNQS